jgi:NAD(P)-dependent dehydrogenase (short-subunit alcohol dehydrogenase family)
MPIAIAGKRIIVTGGARGIGAAAVRNFVLEGAHVVAFDNRPEGEAVTAAADAQEPGSARFTLVDVSDEAAVKSAVDAAAAALGGVDAVFNIAGIERARSAEALSTADWRMMLDVNVIGVANVCAAAYPHMAVNGGSIVNFGSDAALGPHPNGVHYSASKGAVISYSRALAYDWAKVGIRVNSLAPAIWTPMYDEHRARFTKDELAAHDEMMKVTIPLGGRLGDPDTDLAPVLVFLASDASKFITGQIISVNGGAGYTR